MRTLTIVTNMLRAQVALQKLWDETHPNEPRAIRLIHIGHWNNGMAIWWEAQYIDHNVGLPFRKDHPKDVFLGCNAKEARKTILTVKPDEE